MFLKCTSSFLKSIHKPCGCSQYAYPQTYLFFSVGQYQLAIGKMLIACMHMSGEGVAAAFVHSFPPPSFCHLSLTFACTCQCCCGEPLPLPLPLPAAGLKWGCCQSPFVSQQHVHCLNLTTVTHPVVPCPGDKHPPHQLGGMTLLSGTLKTSNLPNGVCELKSPLLEAGLGL